MLSGLLSGMFVQNENAVRLQIVISGKRVSGQKIVHRFIKLQPQRGALMVQKEIDFRIVLLPQADFDVVGDLEQRMEVAQLPQPDHEVGIEMLMALCADVNCFAQSKGVHGYGGPAGIKVLRVGGEDLAILWFDDIAPEASGMEVTGGEGAFESEMIFFSGRELVKFHNFHAEEIGEVVWVTRVGRQVMFVNQAGVKGGNERAAVLDVKFEPIGFASG